MSTVTYCVMFPTLTCLSHFNFVIFLNRKICKIDMSRKLQVGPITAELLARLESTTQANNVGNYTVLKLVPKKFQFLKGLSGLCFFFFETSLEKH